MVVGFQIFVGGTGIVSFGHVAFMAVGAYGGRDRGDAGRRQGTLPSRPAGLLRRPRASGSSAAMLDRRLRRGAARLDLRPGPDAALRGGRLDRHAGSAGDRQQRARPGELDHAGARRRCSAIPDFANVLLGLLQPGRRRRPVRAPSSGRAPGMRARAMRDDPLAAESAGVPAAAFTALWPSCSPPSSRDRRWPLRDAAHRLLPGLLLRAAAGRRDHDGDHRRHQQHHGRADRARR